MYYHNYNLSTEEAEAGGWSFRVPGHPELCSENLSQKKKKKKKIEWE
jgi:hypothetical protein